MRGKQLPLRRRIEQCSIVVWAKMRDYLWRGSTLEWEVMMWDERFCLKPDFGMFLVYIPNATPNIIPFFLRTFLNKMIPSKSSFLFLSTVNINYVLRIVDCGKSLWITRSRPPRLRLIEMRRTSQKHLNIYWGPWPMMIKISWQNLRHKKKKLHELVMLKEKERAGKYVFPSLNPSRMPI